MPPHHIPSHITKSPNRTPLPPHPPPPINPHTTPTTPMPRPPVLLLLRRRLPRHMRRRRNQATPPPAPRSIPQHIQFRTMKRPGTIRRSRRRRSGTHRPRWQRRPRPRPPRRQPPAPTLLRWWRVIPPLLLRRWRLGIHRRLGRRSRPRRQRRNRLPVDAVLFAEPLRLLGDLGLAASALAVLVLEHALDALLLGALALLAFALLALDHGLEAAGLGVDVGLGGGWGDGAGGCDNGG